MKKGKVWGIIRGPLFGFVTVLVILLVLSTGANAITVSNVTNKTPMATTAWILWNASSEANNTVEYSINSDLSDASFSSWNNNTSTPKIKLWGLQSNTTYYYRIWSYNATNESDNVSSSIYNFTTQECASYKLVNATDTSITGIDHPIQEALDMICPSGGEVELAAGTHYIAQGGTIDFTVHTTQKMIEPSVEVEPGHWVGTLTYKYGIILNERNNITITGAGRDATILVSEGTDYPDYDMLLVVKGYNNTIKDLFIKTNGTGFMPETKGDAIHILGKASSIRVENVRVENVNNGVGAQVIDHTLKEYHGIENLTVEDCLFSNLREVTRTMDVHNSTFKNCEVFEAWGNMAFNLNSPTTYTTIEKNTLHNCSYGIFTYTGDVHIIIRDNIIYGTSGAGIYVYLGAQYIDIINNTIRGSATGPGIVILNNYNAVDHVNITNSRIYNNAEDGIHILFLEVPTRTDHDPPYDITIESNTIYNNGRDGIRQNIDLYDIVVKNNIIANNSGYGINHLNDESQFILSYNDVWGNALGSYNNTTAGTGDISEDPLFADPDNGDFHLKSQAGRWNGSDWIKDDETSPCIDAGDPNSSYSNETYPHGQRINIGAYGNTSEASKSPYHKIYLSVPMTIYSNGEYSYPEPPITYKDNQTVNITFNVTDTTNLTINSYTSSQISFTATNTTTDQKMNITVYNGTFIVVNGKKYEIKKDGVVQQTKTASDNKVVFTDIPVGSDYVITEESGGKQHKLPVARPVCATGIAILIVIAYWRYRRRRRRMRSGGLIVLVPGVAIEWSSFLYN